jgi:hypothetical protein
VARVLNLCCDRNIYTINSVPIYGFLNIVLVSLAAMTKTFVKLFYQDSLMIFFMPTTAKHWWINLLDFVV